MEDTAYSEQLRMFVIFSFILFLESLTEFLSSDTLKALPQSLTIKRQIKSKLTKTVTDNSNAKCISRHNKIKYKVTMKMKRTKQRILSTLNSIELWYGSMKEIEGRFGSGVGTYFKFLRWLFGLNLVLCVFSLGWAIFCLNFYESMVKCILLRFIVVPQILYNISAENHNDVAFNVADLFTAQVSFIFFFKFINLL